MAKQSCKAVNLPRLMPVLEWRDARFIGKKKPSVYSIRRWIDRGDLAGKKIGGRYYVDAKAELNESGNALVDKVLSEI